MQSCPFHVKLSINLSHSNGVKATIESPHLDLMVFEVFSIRKIALVYTVLTLPSYDPWENKTNHVAKCRPGFVPETECVTLFETMGKREKICVIPEFLSEQGIIRRGNEVQINDEF
jgi:hypothetical protein